jgi:hypothetical protein
MVMSFAWVSHASSPVSPFLSWTNSYIEGYRGYLLSIQNFVYYIFKLCPTNFFMKIILHFPKTKKEVLGCKSLYPANYFPLEFIFPLNFFLAENNKNLLNG